MSICTMYAGDNMIRRDSSEYSEEYQNVLRNILSLNKVTQIGKIGTTPRSPEKREHIIFHFPLKLVK